MNIKYLVIEICLYYSISYFVDEFINHLPSEYLFNTYPNGGISRKFYFGDNFQMVYIFCALFIVLMIIKLIVAIFKNIFSRTLFTKYHNKTGRHSKSIF